jgi:hypothetical protein
MRALLKKLVYLFTLFFQISCTQTDTPKVLICVYDMGDLNPLRRVMSQLDKEKIPYKVIAVGKAAEVLKGSPSLIPLENIKEERLHQWKREELFDKKTLDIIANDYKPQIVIAGMAAAWQAQTLNYFAEQKVYTIAFYDNFDPIDKKEYVQPFLKEVKKINLYMIPSEETLKSFKVHQSIKADQLLISGQPVLEEWDDAFKVTDSTTLRKELGLTETDKVILFVGGYDDTYEEYFTKFVQGVKSFQDQKDVKFLVTYHPKSGGKIERKVIDQEKASNVTILDKVPSVKLATITKVFVCHKSGMGMHALYAGLPVVYMVEKNYYPNFAIDKGLAMQVETPEELKETLNRILATANKNRAEVAESLGIPAGSTQLIVTTIKSVLKK